MSDEGTQLSNPFSTGGGGPRFEIQVQTAFVVLMLTGGVVPCLPAWPIKKIKLQGRYAGYDTDDFIVFLESQDGTQAKLLGQVKHTVSVTENDRTFGAAIKAAWRDFQNAEFFDPEVDVLALISGPLSATDNENARTILEWARASETGAIFKSCGWPGTEKERILSMTTTTHRPLTRAKGYALWNNIRQAWYSN